MRKNRCVWRWGRGKELHLTLQLRKKFFKDSYWFKGVCGGGDLIIAGSIHAGARKICRDGKNGARSWNRVIPYDDRIDQ